VSLLLSKLATARFSAVGDLFDHLFNSRTSILPIFPAQATRVFLLSNDAVLSLCCMWVCTGSCGVGCSMEA